MHPGSISAVQQIDDDTKMQNLNKHLQIQESPSISNPQKL